MKQTKKNNNWQWRWKLQQKQPQQTETESSRWTLNIPESTIPGEDKIKGSLKGPTVPRADQSRPTLLFSSAVAKEMAYTSYYHCMLMLQ